MNEEQESPVGLQDTPKEINSQAERSSNSMLIFLVFCLVGPPAGFFAIFCSVIIYGIFTNSSSFGLLETIKRSFEMLLIGIPLSYVLGGLQAVFTGLVSATWARITGTIPLLVVASSAASALLLTTLIKWNFNSGINPSHILPLFPSFKANINDNLLITTVYSFSALVCWQIARRILIAKIARP